MMQNYILEVKELKASYEETVVLKGINLDVREKEVLCIVGESGSGKSSLIKAICGDGSLKINDGKILFKGDNISRKLLGSTIGLIQQNPEGAFNPLRRFKGQFSETLKSHGRKLDIEKLESIFSTLGLKDTEKLLKSRPYELSGGMNQRMAIAVSFILEPKLLLCDEITSALDVTTAIAVTDELLRLKNQMNTTIVLVTHNLGIAANIADRIAIMYKGEIVECGDTGDILENPKHDYTKRLLSDVPKLKVI